jgi:hypothetical protein
MSTNDFAVATLSIRMQRTLIDCSNKRFSLLLKFIKNELSKKYRTPNVFASDCGYGIKVFITFQDENDHDCVYHERYLTHEIELEIEQLCATFFSNRSK